MSLKNYRAYTMAEAMAAVKRDLGSDAVILHTRTLTQGGFLGIGKKIVIEVTAQSLPANAGAGPSKRSIGVNETSGRAIGLQGSIASRAYGRPAASGGTASATVSNDEPTAFDRERTRLLAQAMAIQLDREQSVSPRTSASVVANANAAATTVAAQRTVAPTAAPPLPIGSPSAAGVAQRFVLVSPAQETRISERAALLQTPLPVPSATVESVAAPQPIATVVRERQAQPMVQRPASGRERGDDLAAIDRLVSEVLTRSTTARERGIDHDTPQRLHAVYAALIGQEVAMELAVSIVAELRSTLTLEELASDHAVRGAAIERIAALLPSCRGLEPVNGAWRRDGRPLTIAFVGPTGVGKTTTVAKIAATLKLRYGARVGLVTCDTYRIAAVDQLRTYAEIIGLPLEIVLAPSRMRDSIRRMNDLDVVLIDTAGRSQNDTDRLGDLAAMMAAAEPHETHLVLSSVASEKVMRREAQAFSTVGIDRVVLTKLDEAVGLGAALRVLREVGCSVSYITTGQEVPQHIETARPTRLAELLLGGLSAT